MQLSGRRLGAALITTLGALGGATPAHAGETTWLCRPGLASNPCNPGLDTTRITTAGTVRDRFDVVKDAKPKVDCFYVYPTVSDQPGLQANRRIDPELRSIALFQAARYSQSCRVFAPVYRQITLAGLLKPADITTAIRDRAYGDVRTAWREYLRNDNKGRGVVLIGHSQGTFMLRRLIADEIDGKAAERKRLVSALLLGGDVLVKKNRDVGGDFRNVRACRSATQVGCVVAFSVFNATPPNPARFGRPSRALGVGPASTSGLEVLCTNPAALGGGTARVTAVFPTARFAPGTAIGGVTEAVGFDVPRLATPFVQVDDAYAASCSRAGGANVQRVRGAGALKPLPDASWGLHLVDANIALGDLAALVRRQARLYAARR